MKGKKGGRYLVKITELKTNNIHQVRLCFYNGEIWTKNDLAKHTGLSLAATTNILQLLLKDDEIKLVGEAQSTGGRKSKQYILNKDYYHLGNVSLKRDDQYYYFLVKITDLLGNILKEEKLISEEGSIDELLEAISNLICDDYKVTVLALSIPGVCKDGKVGICDFESLRNCELLKLLKEHFNLDIIMDNDVNAASIGFGIHYPNANNLALMYQPKIKYVGCGILINHRLCSGYSNFAGELSYLPFMSHHEQDEMLFKAPNDLLLKQLATICCVINPEIIGVCSDVFKEFDSSQLINYLPAEHWPKIIDIDNLDQLIKDGLYSLGIEVLKNKMRKRDR